MDSKKINNDIVIIEDNSNNLKLLEIILSRYGYSTRSAVKGIEGLNLINNNPPVLVILDIRLPDINGYEVCKKIKNNERTKNIPVIFLSAEDDIDNKINGFKSGGIDYVTKPFHEEEIIARINIHFRLSRLQIELENSNNELKETLNRLKETQNQLIQSEKMASLGTLLSGIAHEINNPLNFIISGMEGIRKIGQKLFNFYNFTKETAFNTPEEIEKIKDMTKILDNEKLSEISVELFNNVVIGIERVTNIMRGLRDFSRYEGVEKEKFDINEAMDLSLLLLNNEYKNFITIEKKYANLPSYLGQKSKISQVFLNIIKNAIDELKLKKEEDEKKIIIETEYNTEGKKIIIKIDDNGSGIPENIKSKIFDPFFTTKSVGSGIGLGLSISYNIINFHGGIIDVKNLMSGTRFEINLPIIDIGGEDGKNNLYR